jgi:hypothetical protein
LLHPLRKVSLFAIMLIEVLGNSVRNHYLRGVEA